jgi:ESS family glutamate:Na+ symporter
MPLEFDSRQTLIIAILSLFLGKFLNRKVGFFRAYNLPEPVTGGILVSLIFGGLYFFLKVETNFDLSGRDSLLIVFFTSIGLNAKFSTLLTGGRPLLILLVAAVGFLIIQNLTGLAVISLTTEPLSTGILGGSISLSGGHGTAIAWAPTLAENYGIPKASEIGIACATFGLILGGLIGGPIARRLITKHHLKPSHPEDEHIVGLPRKGSETAKHDKHFQEINGDTMLACLLVISIAVGLGLALNKAIEIFGLQLPNFVTCLFAGILLTNLFPPLFKKTPWPSGSNSLALISDVSLSLFLAMSLMSLQLWTLFDLAGPIMLLLVAQVAVITFWVMFVVFPAMGRSYDAAIIASGYAGLGLGATPTAIANMTAVTTKYGPSPQSFLIVPLVGAFFIDLANAFVIQKFLNLFG